MNTAKTSFSLSALLIVGMVVLTVSPAAADPTGTTFSFVSMNFQGDGGAPEVPFGEPTSIPGSGVTVDSMVMTSPAIPELLLEGGLEFIEFWITTDDGGYLNETSGADSFWAIDGLSWGPDGLPAVATGLIFLSFDIDGTFVELDGAAAGIPIVPHPLGGHDSIPIDIAGDPVSLIAFDTASLTGTPLLTSLLALGVSFSDALSVNSMHVGLEVKHIPEPASVILLGVGCAALVTGRRRRR